MPPKNKKGQEPSAKTIKKEKDRIVEDKTFGLKNGNKSKVVQAYKKEVQNQVFQSGKQKVRFRVPY